MDVDMRRERDWMRRGLSTTYQKKSKVLEPRVLQSAAGGQESWFGRNKQGFCWHMQRAEGENGEM